MPAQSVGASVVTGQQRSGAAMRDCPCGRRFLARTLAKHYCSPKCRDRAYNQRRPVVRLPALDFDPPVQPAPPVVDQRVPRRQVKRLRGHNARILARLEQGSATNVELAALLGPAAAWRTRVSDVRLWLESHEGVTVKCSPVEGQLGLWRYEITERGK